MMNDYLLDSGGSGEWGVGCGFSCVHACDHMHVFVHMQHHFASSITSFLLFLSSSFPFSFSFHYFIYLFHFFFFFFIIYQHFFFFFCQWASHTRNPILIVRTMIVVVFVYVGQAALLFFTRTAPLCSSPSPCTSAL